ncbi:MAG: diacylglycerol/lipid kinase family protein [Actinomycetota bacterium]
MSVAWFVLVNPAAGRRSVEITRVRNALDRVGAAADIEAPQSVADMRRALAEAAAAGRPRVAVVGGDGTVNLAINEFMAGPVRPILGILPGGTGSDLLRTFGIPQNLEQAAAHLTGENTYRIDVGLLEGDWGSRYFVNVAQAGAGAAAAETAPRLSRRLGKVRYPLAFAARLPRFPYAEVELDIGGRRHQSPALAVIFANAQFFAGGWNVAPRATLNDGRLDLQVINCRKREAGRLVPKIIRGVHLTDRTVRRYATPGFRLVTSQGWPIEADGDLVGNTPVTVSVLPGALDLKI